MNQLYNLLKNESIIINKHGSPSRRKYTEC